MWSLIAQKGFWQFTWTLILYVLIELFCKSFIWVLCLNFVWVLCWQRLLHYSETEAKCLGLCKGKLYKDTDNKVYDRCALFINSLDECVKKGVFFDIHNKVGCWSQDATRVVAWHAAFVGQFLCEFGCLGLWGLPVIHGVFASKAKPPSGLESLCSIMLHFATHFFASEAKQHNLLVHKKLLVVLSAFNVISS